MKKRKSVWCYLDGKKHCDVVQWALAANVSISKGSFDCTISTFSGYIQGSIK